MRGPYLDEMQDTIGSAVIRMALGAADVRNWAEADIETNVAASMIAIQRIIPPL
jgi:hypothetical protein